MTKNTRRQAYRQSKQISLLIHKRAKSETSNDLPFCERQAWFDRHSRSAYDHNDVYLVVGRNVHGIMRPLSIYVVLSCLVFFLFFVSFRVHVHVHDKRDAWDYLEQTQRLYQSCTGSLCEACGHDTCCKMYYESLECSPMSREIKS